MQLQPSPLDAMLMRFVFDATSKSLIYSPSSDGTAVETRLDRMANGSDDASYILGNINSCGRTDHQSWRMLYGPALDAGCDALYIGRDDGAFTCIDRRTVSANYNCSRVSKNSTKARLNLYLSTLHVPILSQLQTMIALYVYGTPENSCLPRVLGRLSCAELSLPQFFHLPLARYYWPRQ